MNAQRLRFRLPGAEGTLELQPRHALVVGYAGRDQEAVRHHVQELAAAGIPAPARTPELYVVTPDLLTQQPELTVSDPRTCGEAECALVLHGGQVYVAVGSDHTDRELEQRDVLAAKQRCPKPVGDELWRLSDLLDHWDELELRSWVGDGTAKHPYQQGTLASLLRPEDVLAFVRAELGPDLDEAVIYCGTMPLLEGKFTTEPSFIAELRDPRSGCALRCAYRVSVTGA